MYRTRVKRDGNHAAIVAALEKAGATVLDLAAVGGGAPDILVGFRGVNTLIEIKDPSQSKRDTKLRDNQVEWHDAWKGRKPAVAMTPEAALVIIGVRPHGLGIDGGDG